MDVSTDITGVPGSMCPYTSTKGTGVQRFMSTENSTVNTVVCGRINAFEEYGRYKPIRDIVTVLVGKVQKGIN